MNEVIEKIIYAPWPWWVGGPLIGIFVIALLLIEGKQLGISSSYQYVCAKLSPIKLDYFKDPEKIAWQFWFAIGLVLGGSDYLWSHTCL
jgi:Na+/H+ antiporter NhaA